MIYLCGSVGLKNGVMKKLELIFDEERHMAGFVKQMIEDKRLVIEAWG